MAPGQAFRSGASTGPAGMRLRVSRVGEGLAVKETGSGRIGRAGGHLHDGPVSCSFDECERPGPVSSRARARRAFSSVVSHRGGGLEPGRPASGVGACPEMRGFRPRRLRELRRRCRRGGSCGGRFRRCARPQGKSETMRGFGLPMEFFYGAAPGNPSARNRLWIRCQCVPCQKSPPQR